MNLVNIIRDMPWMARDAVEYIQKHILPTHHVFEWGSGSSTLFFAERAAAVSSVEHNERWRDSVWSEVMHRGLAEKVRLAYRPPEKWAPGLAMKRTHPKAYRSHAAQCRDETFRAYVLRIEQYPPKRFDWIVIDGRSRNSCAMHAIRHLKRPGWLVFDNWTREAYRPAIRILDQSGAERMAFESMPPEGFKQQTVYTAIWKFGPEEIL